MIRNIIKAILVLLCVASVAHIFGLQLRMQKRMHKLAKGLQLYKDGTLRKIEKSKQTYIYTTDLHFRNESIKYNYTSLKPNTMVKVFNSKNKVVHESKALPNYRLNLFSLKKGYFDTINLQNVDTSGWDDGYYQIELTNETDKHTHPFLYNHKKSCNVLVVASTNTWNAYNQFFNSYIAKAKTVGRTKAMELELPFARPYINDKGTSPWTSNMWFKEARLKQFLDNNNINSCVISNRQYDQGIDIQGYKLIILPYYSEFWSEKGITRLGDDINKGVSLLSLSAGNFFRGIEYSSHSMRVTNAAAENRFPWVSKNLGSHYWFTDPFRKKDMAGYKILNNSHWVFNKVNSDSFANKNDFFDGGSAMETDFQFSKDTDFELLALGNNNHPRNQAPLLYKKFPSGAHVLNFSSLAIIGSLNVDKNTDQIVLNFISQVTK